MSSNTDDKDEAKLASAADEFQRCFSMGLSDDTAFAQALVALYGYLEEMRNSSASSSFKNKTFKENMHEIHVVIGEMVERDVQKWNQS